MAENQVNTSEDVDAILKIALNKSGGTDELRTRLQKSADELGISPEALAQAEAEYKQQRLLKQYQDYKKKDFLNGLIPYVLVNSMLIGIWVVTGREHFWPIYPMMGWGIAVVSSFIRTLSLGKITTDDLGFQKWLLSRGQGERASLD